MQIAKTILVVVDLIICVAVTVLEMMQECHQQLRVHLQTTSLKKIKEEQEMVC